MKLKGAYYSHGKNIKTNAFDLRVTIHDMIPLNIRPSHVSTQMKGGHLGIILWGPYYVSIQNPIILLLSQLTILN